MKITNCIWELNNLGCRVAEVSFNNNEEVVKGHMLLLEKEYDYIVVKIPYGCVKAYMDVSLLGYGLVEAQITKSKQGKDFGIKDRISKKFYDHLTLKMVNTTEHIQQVIEKMTPNMFSTDRVYLDPKFGPKFSLNRYRNWLLSEYEKGTDVYEYCMDEVPVGFNMMKVTDGGAHALLGGLYEQYQKGYGITNLLGILKYKQEVKDFKSFTTCISANNIPMLKIYDYFDYITSDIHYVFVKHLR